MNAITKPAPMLFADRMQTLKDCGLDNAGAVIDYLDRVKQAIATAQTLSESNNVLATLSSPAGIRTRIVERPNPTPNQPSVAVVMLDTRQATNSSLLTEIALRQEDRLALTRTVQIVQEKVISLGTRAVAGVTQGNTVKTLPVSPPPSPLRATNEAVGGRLRDKIEVCLLGGRQVQLLTDEAHLFQRMAVERRLTLSELGLVLDRSGIIRMRSGDGIGDVTALYFDLVSTGEHRAMFRSLLHFARIEPVFVTAESRRPEFRAWFQAFEECRYHTDPRVLRGFGAAGIGVERKTMQVTFPGETAPRQTTGFYFCKPAITAATTAPVAPPPAALDEVPAALLLAAAQRLDMLPNDADICNYLRKPGAADYLWKNILGPRGIALGQVDYAANVETRYGRPYFREPVRLHYNTLDQGNFTAIKDCFQSMRVVAALLGKVRQTLGLQATMRAQIRRSDFLRMINDVALELSQGKISVAFLFEQPSVTALAAVPRKVQQALALCHLQSREYEFLSAVRTALAGVLINIEFL